MPDDDFEINEFCERLQNEGLDYNIFGIVFGQGLTEVVIDAGNSFSETREKLQPLEDMERIDVVYNDPEIIVSGKMGAYRTNP